MARRTKILRKRASRYAKKYPDLIDSQVRSQIRNLVEDAIVGIKASKRYRDHKRSDKYWLINDARNEGKKIIEVVHILLDEIAELQNTVRKATDETIEANIKANAFDTPKEKDLNFKSIIKKSCTGYARPVKEEKE